MSEIKIVTDSTCCIPSELIKEYDIRIVPVGVVIDGKGYKDNIDITLDDFRQMMDKLEKTTTSAGNPGDFLNVFTELSQVTDNIVCILVSKLLTATQESAYQARKMLRAEHPNVNIEIVDSKSSAGAMGYMVLEAARAAREGKSFDEVMEVINDMIYRAIYLSSLDTLKYLIRIGRAPRGAYVGELLDVKPVIGFVDDTGLVEVVARVRGKNKALSTLVDLIPKYVDVKKPLHVMVHYFRGIEEGNQLRDMIQSKYKCTEIYVTEFSPVMVVSSGPMIGLSVYS
jgi:DegV family protein with EDD domain